MIDLDYDRRKVDEVVLALLYLTLHRDGDEWRASKDHDRGALDRLHQMGVIKDPSLSPREVALTDDGVKLAKEFFQKHFGAG